MIQLSVVIAVVYCTVLAVYQLVFVAVYNPVAEFWRSWITVAAPFVVLALPLTADPSVEKVRKGLKRQIRKGLKRQIRKGLKRQIRKGLKLQIRTGLKVHKHEIFF